MTQYILAPIRKLYNLPKPAQWTVAVFMSVVGVGVSITLVQVVYFPFWILLIPVIKTIGHFSIAPLFRLLGLFNYYSPMLLIIKANDNNWEIHNGTTFDYLLNMKWSDHGMRARKAIMLHYCNGLLNIIRDIEKEKISGKIDLYGISYFFNSKTAKLLGFTEEKVRLRRRLLFFIDYLNLFLMYSFSRGTIAFPNIFKVKKIRISGEKLVNSKETIKRIFDNLTRKRHEALRA
ncbi:MAG: hypothetical protein PVH88_09840 [Ignavibacteria bacterium]|jgi:hypothetical protein